MSMRYKGAIISATAPTVTDSQASGAWTLQQQYQYKAANTWPTFVYPYVEDLFSTYLYTGNGSTQTINNGIALAPATTNGGSVSFNGTSTSYLSFSMPTSYFPGTGDFTLEFWINSADVGTLQGVIDFAFNSGGFGFYYQSNYLRMRIAGNDIVDSLVTANILYHVALVRSGTTLSVFLNGTRSGTTSNSTNIVPASTITATISGFNGVGSYPLVNASMSNVRYVKGVAVYDPSSTTITVPTSQLTAVSGTQLLTCILPSQTTDYSTNAVTITKGANATLNPSSGGPSFTNTSVPYYGGLVWIKRRSSAQNHQLFDTSRGVLNALQSNLTNAQGSIANSLTAFNSNGFTVGSSLSISSDTLASWTFRKQPKFFDIVTYTGDGTNNRQIPHNLGSTPGCIIVKKINSTSNWFVYHRTLSVNQFLYLDTTNSIATYDNVFGIPNATNFVVGGAFGGVNESGNTYVAYLFAHDAGGFGLTGNDNVISCGSWTNTASSGYIDITLGYEPQWLLIKNTSTAENWVVVDNMRNWSVTNGSRLMPNLSDAEVTWNAAYIPITSTGFRVDQGAFGASGNTYIYIAIRRGPMKTPTLGTSVFNPNINFSTISSGKFGVTTGFPVDALWWRRYDTVSVSYSNGFMTRLQGNPDLKPYSTVAEANNILPKFDYNTQVAQQAENAGSQIYWSFARAPGFFDIVCYTGNDTNRTINHNLGVAPELIIIKSRSASAEWITSVPNAGWGNTEYLIMNNTFAKNNYGALNVWNGTAPTSTVFSLGTISSVNFGSTNYIAYLFASCAGVSKVGSYTGTGTTQTINCGFTTGARFVMIKRTDSAGDWYVWDSARGIVAGDDPYLLINSTATQVTGTDYIDTANAGFEISSTAPAAINANGGTYIFLAIA